MKNCFKRNRGCRTKVSAFSPYENGDSDFLFSPNAVLKREKWFNNKSSLKLQIVDKKSGEKNRRFSTGFTLIELILYLGIFGVVAGMLTSILVTVTRVGEQQSASAEVISQLNFVTQTIQRLVRSSSNIEMDAGVGTSTLKLRMADSAKDPTCISLVNGVIKLAEGPDLLPAPAQTCTALTSDLTSNKVVVNTLNFKKFTQYPGHDTVSYDITLTYNTPSPTGQVARSLSSAISRVSAATFDAPLLPGASNFDVGQAGAPWQRVLVSDGNPANPSYTFGSSQTTGMFQAGSNILGFGTQGNTRMVIDQTGNVGIGTTTPSTLLELSAAANSFLRITDTTNNVKLQLQANDTDATIGTNSNHPLNLMTNNTNRLQIDTSGNIVLSSSLANIKNVKTPVDGNDAASKDWVLAQVGGGGGILQMQVFDSPGSTSFNVPAGVSRILVEVWGGGGGGGGGANGSCGDGLNNGGGGGGGGGYAKGSVLVTPSEVLSVSVGSGGIRGFGGTNPPCGSGGSDGGGGDISKVSRGVTALVSVTGGSGGKGGKASGPGGGGIGGGLSAPLNNLFFPGEDGSGGSSGSGPSVNGGSAGMVLNGNDGKSPGGGNRGGGSSSGSGLDGAPGRVVIYW